MDFCGTKHPREDDVELAPEPKRAKTVPYEPTSYWTFYLKRSRRKF